jgi:hypothetical protein
MNRSHPGTGTFQETFCAQYGVPRDLYAPTVLRLTLYPHARWLADVTDCAFLIPDRSFVSAVGRLTRWRDFAAEVQAFQVAAANRPFMRRGLRLRVSTRRMRALFSEVMGGIASGETRDSQSRSETGDEPGSLLAN